MVDTIETEAYVIEPERKSRHYKWWFVGLGVLITLLGVVCLAWPAPALHAVAIAVGIGFIVSGITGVASYFDWAGLVPGGGWSLVASIVDVVLGIMFLVQPAVGGVTVAWVAGIAVVAGGVMDAVSSWRLREVAGTGSFALGLVAAVLTVVFGILMFVMPELFVIYLGCLAVLRGLLVIVASFKVSSFIKQVKARIGA